MDKIYRELARQHMESMSIHELQTRLTALQDFLAEITKNQKIDKTETIKITYVMERLTHVLIGDLDVK